MSSTSSQPRFLDIEDLALTYGKAAFALSCASFSARKGEVIALLGPSGCGKTTLLNLIAGFLKPDRGQIRVGGRDMLGVPTHLRDMAMVFQNYALFPHLTVEKNVAFGLEARHVARKERESRVAEALAMVGLSDIRAHYPRQLSGGQQQRIALARALVIRPSILLLDEPLSNLDTLLRKSMREEIKQILDRAAITAVLVTHDQEEALVIADRIVLMSSGRIDQIGSPEDLYERPATVFGARFMAVENLIEGSVIGVDATGVTVQTQLGIIKGAQCSVAVGAKVIIAVRPERIWVSRVKGKTDSERDDNQLSGAVVRASYHGTFWRLQMAVHGLDLIVHTPVTHDDAGYHGELHLSWHRSDTHVIMQ